MIEAPEALILAGQLGAMIKGRTITTVVAGHTPHKFAWFWGDAADYEPNLAGKTIDGVRAVGGLLEIRAGDMTLVMGDGTNLRYYASGEQLPPKHQLLVGFDDESCVVGSVRMYGALMAFPDGADMGNFGPYYEDAKSKPQVMSPEFTRGYFDSLAADGAVQNKSAKAFLATEQCIPGLGNGVLQDILFNARIHPKTKVEKLTAEERVRLYDCVVMTLGEIYAAGGRNSETDLFGRSGGYVPFLSKDTVGGECPRCGEVILKESYMGGSIYYCTGCQKRVR